MVSGGFAACQSNLGGLLGGLFGPQKKVPPWMGDFPMPLTDRAVQQALAKDKPYKIYDKDGLCLLVKPSGKKYWRFKYYFCGKEGQYAIGVYPAVSLKNARREVSQLKDLLAQGIDPNANKKSKQQISAQLSDNSFSKIALEWFEVKIKDQSKSHSSRTLRLLTKELFPKLGHLPIESITPPVLLTVLRAIEERGVVDTAHRAKQVASLVFRYAIITGRAERDPSCDLTGALKSRSKIHYASITEPGDVAKLCHNIRLYEGSLTIQYALKLSPLLMCRPGELRQLEWSEIDFFKGIIEIPKEKMKMRSSHIIPLSHQAELFIKEIQQVTGQGRFVFPSVKTRTKPISDNGVRSALRTMGYDNSQITPHGFRAMARTLLDEVLLYPVEWIEQQLAHTVKDPLGRAYNRTKHLPQRKIMMQDWADYLDWLVDRWKAGHTHFEGYQSLNDQKYGVNNRLIKQCG